MVQQTVIETLEIDSMVIGLITWEDSTAFILRESLKSCVGKNVYRIEVKGKGRRIWKMKVFIICTLHQIIWW
jgi:hypothetical protein